MLVLLKWINILANFMKYSLNSGAYINDNKMNLIISRFRVELYKQFFFT